MQINSDLVTIGLPFFNNEKTLLYAIKSILGQTYSNFELYLIDDGSTDSSYEIARKISETDPRVKLIIDGENRGLVSRLNQIIDLANGNYIARMDADDIMMKTKLEKQIKLLKEKPSIDVIATGAFTIDENNNITGVRDTKPIQIKTAKNVIKTAILIHPTIVAKKSWCLENKYDSGFHRAEDYELWCRTFHKTKFFRISEPLFFYREGKVSLRNYSLSMRTLRKIFRVYGPKYLSFSERNVEIAKTYIKNGLYQTFGVFKMQNLLSARRNQKLSDSDYAQANAILQDLIDT